MKSGPISVMRVAFVMIAGLFVMALIVGLTQHAEDPAKRTLHPARLISINRNLYASKLGELQTLDPATGTITRIELPEQELIDSASFSPWRDEQGNWQVVGCWMDRAGAEMQAAGLARFLYPDGEILDRVDTGIQPVGPPCWFPGGSSKILFAAGDGRLYKFDFGDGQSPRREDRKPRVIALQAKGLDHQLVLYDPIWPDLKETGDTIFVTCSTRLESLVSLSSGTGIWWLQLDANRTTITASGRVTIDGDPHSDEFRPSIATTSDGTPLLAYLVHDAQTSAWEMHLAPLEFDPENGFPRVKSSKGIVLETQTKPGRPIFSPDARELYCALPTTASVPRIARISVSEFGLELARKSDRRGDPREPGS